MKSLRYFLLIAPSAIAVIATMVRIMTTQANHIGFDPYWLLIGIPFALYAGIRSNGNRAWIALTIAALNTAVVLSAVHFNFLLQYEEWIHRGMPEAPAWWNKS